MEHSRQAAVAGMFYPGSAAALESEVRGYLRDAKSAGHSPVAIIAPHAGYVYSGPVAGSAYATLVPRSGDIDRVVLLGPAHREYVAGVAASSAASFSTPLGDVPLDQKAIQAAVDEFDFVSFDDRAHALEHSIEVQLPFLQTVLSAFSLVPFAVGGAQPEQIYRLLEKLWLDRSTLVVVSSDLSHYQDYARAKALDTFTSSKIEALDPTGLSGDNACGQRPICGLLMYAARHRMRCEILDVRNSGDTAGGRDRVVGYGAYLFYEQ
jgi:AmmeMemoRadiSam system protein B